MKEKTFEKIKEKEEEIFNPERDITKDDWQGMKSQLEEFRQDDYLDDITAHAMKMRILFPEKSSELGLDEELWKKMKKKLEEFHRSRGRSKWEVFANKATEMKILFPEKSSELGLDEETWEEMREKLEHLRHDRTTGWGRGYEDFVSYAAQMRILFPEKSSELGLDEKELPVTRFGLGQLRQKEKRDKRELGVLLTYAADMRIIFPEAISSDDLDEELWKKMKEELEEYRKNDNWIGFSQQAMEMKILSADKVKVDENGLKIE